MPELPESFRLSVSAGTTDSRVTDADAIRLGRKGGRANTPEQRASRRLNAYRTLARRYPTSVKVQQELKRLELESERKER